jgi:hypothetical protein
MSFNLGGGIDLFIGRRSGATLGFDFGHVSADFSNGKRNYGRLYFGYFFQTKAPQE